MVKRVKSFLLENKTPKQTIAKNTFWLFFGNIGSRAIRAITIIYAARILGATGLGAFSYGLSIAALFTIFTDFGISSMITREASRDITVQKKYFSTAIIIKLVMIILMAVLILALSPILFKEKSADELVILIILIVSFDSMKDFGSVLSRAWEKMEIESMIQFSTNVIIVISSFIALNILATPKSFAMGYVIGTGLGMLIAFYPLRSYLKNITKEFSTKLAKSIIISSWPIGMTSLMGAVMINTDTIMIGWFKSLTDVGYYSAAQRIVQIFYIIPGLISSAFFPSLSRLVNDKEKIANMVETMLTIFSFIAIPLSVGGVILAGPVLKLLYGAEYLPGTTSFIIMNLTYLPIFFSAVLGSVIFATNKERHLLFYVLLGISGNFIFNLLLIPFLGIAGASLSTLINQIIITGYLIYKLKKEIRFSIITNIKKIIIASAIMMLAIIIMLVIKTNIYLILFLAIAIYVISLYLLKEKILFQLKSIFKS